VDIGTQDKKKLLAAVGLGVLAVVVIAYEFLGGSSTPAASTSAATTPTARPVAKKTGKNAKILAEPRLDPTLDLTLLAATEQTKYNGNGRNIFVAGAEPTPMGNGTTDHPAKEEATGPYVAPPPPPPPPITLKFFGFANKPGEPKKIFLSQGEDVFIAAEGDIVNRRYKVVRISPNAVDIEDVLYNNRQSIPLTQG
jgi:hypothetical protein